MARWFVFADNFESLQWISTFPAEKFTVYGYKFVWSVIKLVEQYWSILAYRIHWLDRLSCRSIKRTTEHLVKIMCSVGTHWKINHIAIDKRRRRILPGNLDPLWIEVILAHIGVIWNVTHDVFSQCCFTCEINVSYIRRRIQTTTSACVRHHNQLQSAWPDRIIRARTTFYAQDI